MSSTREPVTAAERTILKDLAKTIGEIESQFCCGGIIPISPERKFSLFYLGQENIRSLDLPPTKDTDIDKLLDACVPSSHGRGNKTVYDESYRLARELHQGNFALNADILNESGVLDTITALTSSRGPTARGLVAHLYKLNIYGVGGFFKAHRDTPKSDRHIGTLVVTLPIPFKGGALRVKHEDKEVLFDWSEENFASSETPGLPWAFLFSDVEHEVLPVTSGTRITLAYDIFMPAEAYLAASLAMDFANLSFYSDLKAALKNPEFLPNGGRLGVALSHKYPVDSKSYSENFATRLKGGDAVLCRALYELGITKTRVRAIYLSNIYTPNGDYSDLEEYKVGIPDDGFGILYPFDGSGDHSQVLLTLARYDFMGLEDIEWAPEREAESERLGEVSGAHVEHDVIWVRRPSQDVYTPGGHYVNEYEDKLSVSSMDIAPALLFDVPAMGQGIRITS